MALVLVTGWAATRAARLELDIENRSMQSPNSAEAQAEEKRERLFGHDATLVLLLEPRHGEGDYEFDIDPWIEALRARPEVDQLLPLSSDHAGEALLALTLVPDESGAVADNLASLVAVVKESAPASYRLSISGSPAGEAAIASALDEEQRRIVPLVGAVLFVLLLCVYRSLALALGALLPALGGILWTGALQEALGYPINPVTALLPPLLLAVGVAASVHVVDAYLEPRSRGADPDEATRIAMGTVRRPALGCAGTTMVGFLALCTSPVPAIGRFGLLAAGGVFATTLFAFLTLPAWLRRFARSDRLIPRAAGHGPWRRTSVLITGFLARWGRILVGLAALGAVFLGWAWTRLTVDTDPLRILPVHHPFREATARIGERLGGTEVFDLLLEGPGPKDGLFRLLGLQQGLLALDGVAGPGGPPRTAEDGTGLVSLLLKPAGSTARERTFAEAEDLAREQGWAGASASGSAVRVARDSGAIARGEIRALLATFLALGPCIWIGLRSLRLTALGLTANTMPGLAMHGGLALVGRPLSVASAMIGSVVLGLVIDQAIYFLHGYRAQRARAMPRLAVARTLQKSGRALTVSSAVLTLGFLAGLAGELNTTREFGLLASSSILAAWVTNMLLLPCLLLLRRRLPAGSPGRHTP